MYPPRSNKNNARRRVKKKKGRFNRSWLLLNLLLVSMIVMLFSYYWLTRENTKQPLELSNPSTLGSIPTEDITTVKTDIATNEAETVDSIPLKEKELEEVAEPDVVAPEVTLEVSKKPEGFKEPVKMDTTASKKPEGSKETDVSKDTEDAPSEIVTNADTILTFHFGGDMIFSGKVESKLNQEGYDYPFQYVSDLFLKDDLTIANLETPVTTAGVGAINKQYVFKSSPKALEALKKAGMDAVGLANNHILDQGTTGLLDTLQHLDESKLDYAGAGKDADEAYAPKYFTRQGVKIALIAVSRVAPDTDWFAQKGKPGVASVYDPAIALKSIATARKNADIVIVMAHWGVERSLNPNDNQKDLAHQFVDAGADLVIGSHPHVLQGIEHYKGKWIAYSTGNFIFTKSATPSTWKTAVFKTTCTPKAECKMKLIPFHAEVGRPVPMSEEEGQQLFQDIEKLSIGGVRINKDGTVVGP